MSRILLRTSRGMSTYVSVEISPATTTRPVVTSVSHATRLFRSSCSTASRIVSETWSAILSGWPSVTDSDVKRNSREDMAGGRLAARRSALLDLEEQRADRRVAVGRRVREQAA